MNNEAKSQRWIFLRGLVRGRGHWADFESTFRKKFPNAQVELIDLKGNGDRHNETSPRSISEFTEDLRSKSELIKDGPVHILALSLGGMIAADWGHRYPQEVSDITLVCSSAGNLSQPWERMRLQSLLSLAPLVLEKSPAAFENTLLSVITNNHEARMRVLPEMIEYTSRNPAGKKNLVNQLLAAMNYKAPRDLAVPALVVGSYGDKLVAPECSLKIAKHWGCEAVMHPWGGHDLPLDDGDWLVEKMAEFQKSVVSQI